MNGRGCFVRIESVVVEEVERVTNFVRIRLGAVVATEDDQVNTFLKVIGEGEDGHPVKEYMVAGMASRGNPAVCRELVLDRDVFGAICRWRVTGVICYEASNPQDRCECQPPELFMPATVAAVAEPCK